MDMPTKTGWQQCPQKTRERDRQHNNDPQENLRTAILYVR